MISGGAGVFYSHVFTNIIDNIQGSSPNAAAKNVLPGATGRARANWSSILNVCSTCAITTKPRRWQPTHANAVINPNLLDPVTFEYNLRVQRELPGSFIASAEFVGNRSEKLYQTEEFNPTTPEGPRVIPTRGRIILEDNGAASNYNAVELNLDHRARHGLAMRTAYTAYSKLLDDGSEIFTDAAWFASFRTFAEVQRASRRREYGPSAFDHRQRFVTSINPMLRRCGTRKAWLGWLLLLSTTLPSRPLTSSSRATRSMWRSDLTGTRMALGTIVLLCSPRARRSPTGPSKARTSLTSHLERCATGRSSGPPTIPARWSQLQVLTG